jgi:tetratricopeptide (TPR) repeat protein
MERRLLGGKHPELALALNNLALVLRRKGDLAGAEATYRQALAMQRELLGNVHPDVANTLNNLAFVVYDRGDLGGALQAESDSLEIYRQLFPHDNPDVARIMNRIGYWYIERRDYTTADRYLGEALAMRRRLFSQSHPEIASSLLNVGILQVATGKYRDALVSSRTAADIYTAALSATNWKTALAESINGAALTGIGKYQEAEKRLMPSYTILIKDAGALPMYRELARRYLEELYQSWGRPRDARRYAALVEPAAKGEQAVR